jgi:hypothetical protein
MFLNLNPVRFVQIMTRIEINIINFNEQMLIFFYKR